MLLPAKRKGFLNESGSPSHKGDKVIEQKNLEKALNREFPRGQTVKISVLKHQKQWQATPSDQSKGPLQSNGVQRRPTARLMRTTDRPSLAKSHSLVCEYPTDTLYTVLLLCASAWDYPSQRPKEDMGTDRYEVRY